MNTNPWREWADKAASHIKFAPDRGGVVRELMDHMEDRAEALKERGVPEYEAGKAALEAMGDPDEVGRQLAAVHKPWLGRLWRLTQVVLALSLAAALWFVLTDPAGLRSLPEQGDSFLELALENVSGDTAVTYLYPECSDRSDGYRFSVSRAVLLEDDSRILYLEVCTQWWPMMGDLGAFQDFYAVDDLGNVYISSRKSLGNEEKVFGGNAGRFGPFHCVYDARVHGLEPEAQWVELRYDRDGRDVRLRIDLTGGEPG